QAPPRALQGAAHFEVLLDAHAREDLPPLRDLADAELADAVRREAGDVLPGEANPSARRPVHPGDGADERGLAGAVRADDGDDLAVGDGKRNTVERLRVAVEEVEPFDLEHHA